MKSEITIITLLLVSLFAVSFVIADENADTSVDVKEILDDAVSSDDINDALKNTEELVDYKKIGFVKIWRAKGWIENGESGRLLEGFWLSQRFATIDTNSQTIEDVQIARAFGKIHLAGAGNYNLVKMKDNSFIENSTTVNFYVILANRDKLGVLSEDELAINSVGTLVLLKEQEFNDLTTWSGELNIATDNDQKIWRVHIATDVKRMTPRQMLATADAIKVGKTSFWKRIQFWKKNKEEIKQLGDNIKEEIEKNSEIPKREVARKVLDENEIEKAKNLRARVIARTDELKRNRLKNSFLSNRKQIVNSAEAINTPDVTIN